MLDLISLGSFRATGAVSLAAAAACHRPGVPHTTHLPTPPLMPTSHLPTPPLMSTPLFPSPPLRSFLAGLFALALDASAAVRKAVCTGLVSMLMAVPERLEGSMTNLIEYMLKSTQVGMRVCMSGRVAGGVMQRSGRATRWTLEKSVLLALLRAPPSTCTQTLSSPPKQRTV